jgi:rare lipoprotein A
VIVRINDRGPFIRGRVIDLSQPASKKLGITGLGPVCLTVLPKEELSTQGWTATVVPTPQQAPRNRNTSGTENMEK